MLDNNMTQLPANQISFNLERTDLPKRLWDLRHDDPNFDGSIHIHQLERGEVLASAADLRHQIYLLMHGRIHLVHDSEGRRLVVATLDPGAIFGEGALLDSGDLHITAEAATDGIAWSIPATEARKMAIQYPILGWGLLQTYGSRLQQVESRLEDTAYKRLPDRLAVLLVELSHGNTGSIQGISHQDLAERLGTYRETISAILRDFKQQGFVRLGYRHIEVINIESLKELAGIGTW